MEKPIIPCIFVETKTNIMEIIIRDKNHVMKARLKGNWAISAIINHKRWVDCDCVTLKNGESAIRHTVHEPFKIIVEKNFTIYLWEGDYYLDKS